MLKTKPIHTDGKLLVFDLETTGFDANRGRIICAAAKWVGQKQIFSWRIDDAKGFGTTPQSFLNDAEIVAPLVELCNKADAVIAYYGDYGRFDVPYLNTRAVANGLSPTAPLTVIDPHRTARRSLKLARNSLDAVATLLKTQHQKQHIPWPEWEVAPFGDRKAIDKLLAYCKNDVRVLEEVYLALRPLIKNHPYVGSADSTLRCPACGSGATEGHGRRMTKNFILHRRRCTSCGTVFEGKREKV
jgi:uncharacterized protein YprB with RNaseH-like and TPR domain